MRALPSAVEARLPVAVHVGNYMPPMCLRRQRFLFSMRLLWRCARRFPIERLRVFVMFRARHQSSRVVVDHATPLCPTVSLPPVRCGLAWCLALWGANTRGPRLEDTTCGHRGGIEALSCQVCSDDACEYACAIGVSRSMSFADCSVLLERARSHAADVAQRAYFVSAGAALPRTP